MDENQMQIGKLFDMNFKEIHGSAWITGSHLGAEAKHHRLNNF